MITRAAVAAVLLLAGCGWERSGEAGAAGRGEPAAASAPAEGAEAGSHGVAPPGGLTGVEAESLGVDTLGRR